jgi:hypothetical protein
MSMVYHFWLVQHPSAAVVIQNYVKLASFFGLTQKIRKKMVVTFSVLNVIKNLILAF